MKCFPRYLLFGQYFSGPKTLDGCSFIFGIRGSQNLAPIDKRLLDETLADFRDEGADLPTEKRCV